MVGSQTAVSHSSKRERMWYYVHYRIVDAATSRSCFINYVFVFAPKIVECKRSFLQTEVVKYTVDCVKG